jgi:hypothetical protein
MASAGEPQCYAARREGENWEADWAFGDATPCGLLYRIPWNMEGERPRPARPRALYWAGLLIAGGLFGAIALCEGYFAQRPPDYLRFILMLLPIGALWASLVGLALLFVGLGSLPLPHFVKLTLVLAAVLSPFLAWPFTQVTAPLVESLEERAEQKWRMAIAQTDRRHFEELTGLFAKPQRVTALEGDQLILESGVAVELHLVQSSANGALKSFLQREIVGRTVQVCLPENFLELYHSYVRIGFPAEDPRITRPYGNVPVLMFADGELINLRSPLNDWARSELLRCEHICREALSSAPSHSRPMASSQGKPARRHPDVP